MKTAVLCTLIVVFAGVSASRSSAGFSSLWVFGDGVCTTTDNPGSGSFYYGDSYCNGRVWVEVLAQWQGVPYVPAQNNSFFGQFGGVMLANVNALAAPPDAGTALLVIWANNADFVKFTQQDSPPPYDSGDLPVWEGLISQSISDHAAAMSALYAKGVRTVVMPLAVDLNLTPDYNLPTADAEFIRQRTIEYNSAFAAAMRSHAASLPGMTVFLPDTFAFLDDLTGNPGTYGLVNPGIGAVDDLFVPPDTPPAFAGPGGDYVFWDYLHPTAKAQLSLARLVQQMISPVRITGLARAGSNLELQLANVPIGLGGFVDGSTALTGWSEETTIPADSATETIVLPYVAPERFYRARFPMQWVFP